MTQSFWRGKKVVVTGASGFIGSHFVEELFEQGANVIGLYRKSNSNIKYIRAKLNNINLVRVDLNDTYKLCKITEGAWAILNCAALDGNAEFKKRNSAEIVEANTKIILSILRSAEINRVQNVLLLSSVEVYPLEKSGLLKPLDYYLDNFDNTENGYVVSKRFTEIIGRIFAKQYKMNIFIHRPVNTYGPRDKFDGNNKIIPTIISNILNKTPITIWGDGKQTRSFVYVKDLVKISLSLIEENDVAITNIVSPKSTVSIDMLVGLVARITNIDPTIVRVNAQLAKFEKRHYYTEANKLSQVYKMHDLISGLKETIEWYEKNK